MSRRPSGRVTDYDRGYAAGYKKLRSSTSGASKSGRPRMIVSDLEAYERGYRRGLDARRRKDDVGPRCAGCGVTMIDPAPLCGFCVFELAPGAGQLHSQKCVEASGQPTTILARSPELECAGPCTSRKAAP